MRGCDYIRGLDLVGNFACAEMQDVFIAILSVG